WQAALENNSPSTINVFHGDVRDVSLKRGLGEVRGCPQVRAIHNPRILVWWKWEFDFFPRQQSTSTLVECLDCGYIDITSITRSVPRPLSPRRGDNLLVDAQRLRRRYEFEAAVE